MDAHLSEVHGQNGNKLQWRQVKTVTAKWRQKGQVKTATGENSES